MNLDEVLQAQAVDRVMFRPAFADEYPNVLIRGKSVRAYWLDGIYTRVNDPVMVAELLFKDALPTYVVVGTFTGRQPREGTVAVVPGGSATITVTGSDAKTYTATFLSSYTPTVGHTVRLMWHGTLCTVLGQVGATPAPAVSGGASTPPPPAASSTGQLTARATDSGTYSVGFGWNSRYGTNLHQGNASAWGGPADNRGAWFYNGQTANLAGKTITRVQFYVPPRTSAGSFATQTIHLYTHNNNTRPAGDVTRTTGPHDISIPYPFGGQWVDLPTTVGDTLKAGGGMGIFGAPYMGFHGLSSSLPHSGQLVIDWRT